MEKESPPPQSLSDPPAETARMAQLRRLLEKSPRDPFLIYGLGMELKKVGDAAGAIEHFNRTLEIDPGYAYAYYQKGQVQEAAGDAEAAKRTYRDGIEAAKKKGDAHAAGEIEAALSLLE
jgi:tetratricopeptide (TPR) repeat protein